MNRTWKDLETIELCLHCVLEKGNFQLFRTSGAFILSKYNTMFNRIFFSIDNLNFTLESR
jgi:hypothetical protein